MCRVTRRSVVFKNSTPWELAKYPWQIMVQMGIPHTCLPHALTHTHTVTLTHTDIHTHTPPPPPTCNTHVHIYTCMHTHTHACHMQTHAHAHRHRHTHTHTHTHTHARTHSRKQAWRSVITKTSLSLVALRADDGIIRCRLHWKPDIDLLHLRLFSGLCVCCFLGFVSTLGFCRLRNDGLLSWEPKAIKGSLLYACSSSEYCLLLEFYPTTFSLSQFAYFRFS